jgi:hypothetical protein
MPTVRAWRLCAAWHERKECNPVLPGSRDFSIGEIPCTRTKGHPSRTGEHPECDSNAPRVRFSVSAFATSKSNSNATGTHPKRYRGDTENAAIA